MYYKKLYYFSIFIGVILGYLVMEYVTDFGLREFFGNYRYARWQAVILFAIGNIIYISLVGFYKLISNLGLLNNKKEKL